MDKINILILTTHEFTLFQYLRLQVSAEKKALKIAFGIGTRVRLKR